MSKAVIFTKTTCPFCVEAKKILSERGVTVEEHVLGVSPLARDKQAICEAVGREINTVPQIILDGTYIGGCAELKRHYGLA